VSVETSAARRNFGALKAQEPSESYMLHYAIVFFIIAIIAAFFGFGGIAAGAAGIAKVLFVVFLIGAIVTLLIGRSRV
jgi:uncharacterized membrane protein YtjA (UPF0391 family)